jgi:hypothetical protein
MSATRQYPPLQHTLQSPNRTRDERQSTPTAGRSNSRHRCRADDFRASLDPIVMARANPPIPIHPMLYRSSCLPLFPIEFNPMLLLMLLPAVRVTAYASYAVAAMSLVFALWAVFGFPFPVEPRPLSLNVISKILCFVAVIMLFVWRENVENIQH